MANPIPTDHATVLQAVVDRLIDQLEDVGVSGKTCFIADEPEIVETPSADNLFITVCPIDSQFDEGALVGAAENLCIEESGVLVSIHSAMDLDRVEHAKAVLTNSQRGLLVIKQRILKALTGHRLVDGGGNELLVNLIHPMRAQNLVPRNDRTRLKRVSLMFSTDFQWDLS